MNTSPGRICRLGFIRKKLRAFKYKVLLGLFIAVSLAYLRSLFKPQRRFGFVGWPWHDTDFNPDAAKNEILILRWTTFWDKQYDVEVLTSKTCSNYGKAGMVFHIPCRITFDKRYLSASHALVFHSWDLTREGQHLPKTRSTEQLWVYLQEECPKYTYLNLSNYGNVFNWTMTYRRDSDVYYPYGQVVPIGIGSNNSNAKTDLGLGKRPNLVAWIVSRCDVASKRQYFVKELQNHIPVTVYGWCGQDCPAGDCYAHVAKTHKFYLSFENSLCKDYITEKFFNALRANLVPVVYGGTSLEDYSDIAPPPGSYIDARNFKSAKHLAEYLVHLDLNEEEYMKYFEWKLKYKVIVSQDYCGLCQRVFEHTQLGPEKRSYKLYRDLWTWWNYLDSEPKPTVEQDELSVPSPLSIIGPNYKLGAPACQCPIEDLTGSQTKLLNFEPGYYSRKRISKWAKNALANW